MLTQALRISFNIILLPILIGIVRAAPTRHVNGDKIHYHHSNKLSSGASQTTETESDAMAFDKGDAFEFEMIESIISSSQRPPDQSPNSVSSTSVKKGTQTNSGYLVFADDIGYEPPYELTVNPFLSHIEQGWRLKPLQDKYQRKKGHKKSKASDKYRMNIIDLDEEIEPLPLDPSQPHFIDSDEEDDDRPFGDEEKDLRELFNVLFSGGYF